MPEIAEVAIFAKDIKKAVGSSSLISVERGTDAIWSNKIISMEHFEYLSMAAKIGIKWDFMSVGKKLLFLNTNLDKVYATTISLGMTGGFRTEEAASEIDERHKLLKMRFSNGITIYYVDYRRFGRWNFLELQTPKTLLKQYSTEVDRDFAFDLNFGSDGDVTATEKPDPAYYEGFYQKYLHKVIKSHLFCFYGGYIGGKFNLDPEFPNLYYHSLNEKSRGRKPRISVLLDSGPHSGIGNYLANEALGELDLSPFEPFRNAEEFKLTVNTCGKIAIQSFVLGGNSFNGGYYQLDGSEGIFADEMRFYQQPGIPRHQFRGRPVYTRFNPSSSLLETLESSDSEQSSTAPEVDLEV